MLNLPLNKVPCNQKLTDVNQLSLTRTSVLLTHSEFWHNNSRVEQFYLASVKFYVCACISLCMHRNILWVYTYGVNYIWNRRFITKWKHILSSTTAVRIWRDLLAQHDVPLQPVCTDLGQRHSGGPLEKMRWKIIPFHLWLAGNKTIALQLIKSPTLRSFSKYKGAGICIVSTASQERCLSNSR